MSLPGFTVEAPSSGVTPGSAAARAHLFNAGSVEHYRQVLADGVDRVATRVAGTDRPFTGVSPDELAPRSRRGRPGPAAG